MKRIYKYQLETIDEQFIEVPLLLGNMFEKQVLKVDTQHGIPCIWIMVDDEQQKIRRKILIRGTGHECSGGIDPDTYLGSYQLYDGAFVGHVFGF